LGIARRSSTTESKLLVARRSRTKEVKRGNRGKSIGASQTGSGELQHPKKIRRPLKETEETERVSAG